MKIRTTSWHYRLLRLWDMRRPTNLCRYFWKVVWALALFPIAGVFALAVLFTASYPLWLHFVDANMFPMGVAAFAIWAALGWGILDAYRTELAYREVDRTKWWHRDLWPRVTRPKSVNLVVEYGRAVKYKVCPLLEYVDD